MMSCSVFIQSEIIGVVFLELWGTHLLNVVTDVIVLVMIQLMLYNAIIP